MIIIVVAAAVAALDLDTACSAAHYAEEQFNAF